MELFACIEYDLSLSIASKLWTGSGSIDILPNACFKWLLNILYSNSGMSKNGSCCRGWII
jgi:hypothetical protein